MKKLVLIGVLVIVAVGAFVMFRGSAPEYTSNTTPAPTESPAVSPGSASDTIKPSASPSSKVVTVTYSDNGYTPSSVTIPVGGTVTWKNESSQLMWTASNPHPVHNGYPEPGGCISSTFDACMGYGPGTSWSFTFDKIGTWGYHNHLRARNQGVVIVQ